MKPIAIVLLALLLAPVAALSETKVPASSVEITLGFVPVVKKAAPSVVNIYAKRIVANAQNPFADDPFFSEFFRNFDQPEQRVQNSLGSGVILSDDGLVVSNYHVVGGASEIRVVLQDRREFDAEVLLADETSDLAVLKLRGAENLPAIELRRSAEVEVGELVLAIGNPFGVGQTVSSGIVSGLARSGGAVGNARAYFIQTDAPINPGNSGGALVDVNGALIGINTSILTRSGGSNGIGFAIPSDLVAAFLKQARQGARQFQRPWAGMVGQLVDAALAEGLGLARPEGMIVADLHRDSPFAKAGIGVGDVLVAIEGNVVNSPAEMLFHMSVLGVGSEALVTYFSDRERHDVRLPMVAAPESPPRETTRLGGGGPLDGLTLSRINPGLIAEAGLPLDAEGLVVQAVEGTAARVGFRIGDILLEVNGLEIAEMQDARDAANERSRIWDLSIRRDGQVLTMRLRL